MKLREAFGRAWTEGRLGWLLIATAVLVVYWPLTTFQYTINGGDTFNCWLPWRWFMGLSLQNGHFPTWNPYQQMGYPPYADLQGPAWYPEALALGGTVGHTIYTLQALFLFYVIVGGIGMQRLCRVMHGASWPATIAGLGYALGGFFAAHQMHFYSIISAAWLPWLFAAQLRLMRAPGLLPAVEAAVVLALLLTGGNHTFTIISAYLLLAFFIVHVWKHWRGERAALWRLVRYEVLFVALTVVMACGTFYALWDVHPYLQRAGGLPYVWAGQGPFTWRSLPSLFFPAQMGPGGYDHVSDPTMSCGYMGVVLLALGLSALFRVRSEEENVWGIAGLVAFLLALGSQLPIHGWAWRWVPGFALFRFPSYFLLFTALAVAVLAAGSLSPNARWKLPEARVRTGAFLLLLIIGTLLFLVPEGYAGAPPEALRRSLFERVRGWGQHTYMAWSWSVTAAVLIAAALFSWAPRKRPLIWMLLVLLEMGWNIHLAQWSMAVSDLAPGALWARIEGTPHAPVPPAFTPIGWNANDGERLHPLWQNTATFEAVPTQTGFNSFWPAHTYRLLDEFPKLAAAMARQPFVYLSDRVAGAASIAPTNVDPVHDSDLVILEAGEPVPVGLGRSAGDQLRFITFAYDGFTMDARTARPTFLVVQQSWFPGWTMAIDDHDVPVRRLNVAAFGTTLPAGSHHVEVRFRKPAIPWLLALSLITFIGSLVLLSMHAGGGTRPWALGGCIVLAGLLGWSLLAHGSSVDEARREARQGAYVADTRGDRILQELGWDKELVLDPASPYTPALVTTSDSLLKGSATLIIDLEYKRRGSTSPSVAVERSVNGALFDYDASPFGTHGGLDTTWRPLTIVRDIHEFRYPGEQVKIYAWNNGPGPLLVRHMRIRTRATAPWHKE